MKITGMFRKLAWTVCVVFLVIISVNATSLSNLYDNNSISRWSFGTTYSNNEHGHVGTKTVYFEYDSYATESLLSDDVDDAISEWGSAIDLSEGTGIGDIMADPLGSSGPLGQTALWINTSTGAIYLWGITINTDRFPNMTERSRIVTIAHEIGHTYGLGPVSALGFYADNSIMVDNAIYVNTMAVRSTDETGMSVVAHEHTHGPTLAVGGTVTQYNVTKHKATCNTCLAYALESHSFTYNPETGYYVCDICGYQTYLLPD